MIEGEELLRPKNADVLVNRFPMRWTMLLGSRAYRTATTGNALKPWRRRFAQLLGGTLRPMSLSWKDKVSYGLFLQRAYSR